MEIVSSIHAVISPNYFGPLLRANQSEAEDAWQPDFGKRHQNAVQLNIHPPGDGEGGVGLRNPIRPRNAF